MTLAEAIYAHLSLDSGLKDLVSDYIYPVNGPEGAIGPDQKPCVVYQLTSQSGADDGITATTIWHSDFAFAVFANDYSTAWAIGDAVRDCLHQYQGMMGGEVDGVSVLACEMTSRADDSIAELGVYVQTLQFTITHAA